MNEILWWLSGMTDDIVVFLSTDEEYDKRLESIFKRPSKRGTTLNAIK